MKVLGLILLIFGVVGNSVGQTSSEQIKPQKLKLKGGVAQIDITPPVGGRLAGHFYESLSTGIHDSLKAKAMVLHEGNEKFAFVFCDLIGITLDISAPARAQASAKTGIPVKNILIAATHSHTGPLFYGFQHDYFHKKALRLHGEDPHEKVDYAKFLISQIVKVIVKASDQVSPVDMEVGIGKQHDLSFNRRYYMKDGSVLFNPGPLNPDIVGPAGPIDPDVGILLLRDARNQQYKGGLTVFAMHADGVGGTEISADYPFYLEQVLKNKFGQDFISAFAVGPSGDINHVNIRKDDPIYSPSHPSRFGGILAETVIREVPKLKTVNKPALTIRSAQIALPLQVPGKTQIDSARRIIHHLYEVKESGEYMARAGGESGDFLKRVEMSKYISLEGKGTSMLAEVQVFKIDAETAIVGLSGEIFVELGLAIKRRSPFKNTLIVTVCNEKMSYIPTKKAFREGSYEVTNSIVKPGSGEMLVETAIKLLKEIKK